jgi:hypothetical protein
MLIHLRTTAIHNNVAVTAEWTVVPLPEGSNQT